ncbi:type II secretion system protein [Clostridium tertium]|uniref:type II secretion system protein n=1 Tax=Clostridium tertium TaxID=1559 RepID=UPI0023B2DD0B|nr:type II secretion system protein [Clostridium tertium]
MLYKVNKTTKRKGFTLVELLVVLTIVALMSLAVLSAFKVLTSTYNDTQNNVKMMNTIDSINSNIEQYKFIDTDIVINTVGDPINFTEDANTVQDEIYITDRTNPNNYMYLIFKDDVAYLVKGEPGNTTTKLSEIESMSIREINKVMINTDTNVKYANIDSNKRLLEFVIKFKNDQTIRIVKSFASRVE